VLDYSFGNFPHRQRFAGRLPRTLPIAERYTYDFEGNSQVLDHILLSASLAGTGYAHDVVHVNSEFANQLSDHDPQVVRIPLG
jgi:predicted extracellular nuclease